MISALQGLAEEKRHGGQPSAFLSAQPPGGFRSVLKRTFPVEDKVFKGSSPKICTAFRGLAAEEERLFFFFFFTAWVASFFQQL